MDGVINKSNPDYDISFHTMTRDVLKAIHKFKMETGTPKVEIETFDNECDEEFNEETEKFSKKGNKLRIKVYIGVSHEQLDEFMDDGDDDDDE